MIKKSLKEIGRYEQMTPLVLVRQDSHAGIGA